MLSEANSSVMEALDGLLEPMNFGWRGFVTSKEEDLSLTPQKAEQATEGQRPSVAGEADMVRLVADGASSKYPCR